MNRQIKRRLLTALVATLGSVPAQLAVDGDSWAAVVDIDQPSLQHAARFRAELALEASDPIIRRAATDRDSYPDMTWGIPLSVDEAAEIQRRIDVWQDMLPAVARAEEDPAWAGWWLDHAAGGQAVLQFAGDADGKLAALASLIPRGTSVRAERVELTLRDLNALRDELVSREVGLTSQGIELTAIGLDVRANALAVSVRRNISGSQAAIADEIGSRFSLREEPPAGPDTCPASGCLPVKGGIGIADQRTSGNTPCTIGYMARRTDTVPDKLVFVTAGHCVQFAAANDPWRHGSVNIGSAATEAGVPVETWFNEANADVGVVDTNLLPSVPSIRNQILIDDIPETVLRVQAVRTHSQQPVGLPVCRMGRTTGRQCGTITINDARKKSEVGSAFVWINHTVVYSRDAVGGDSGGPVFLTDQDTPTSTPWAILLGTHVHSFPVESQINPTGTGWYSPQDRGRTALLELPAGVVGVSPCTTTTCGLP